jgi:aldehyde:ferredoxin oxidoreductase
MHTGGWTGRFVYIDLTKKEAKVLKTPRGLCEGFIGGRGFGVVMLKDFIELEPFSEEMPIVFSSGPLVGTPVPTSGRGSLVSRSPLTGTVFDCSVGGRFSTELKRAGYDMLVIQGRADRWLWIEIKDNEVSFNDATELQGLTTDEVFRRLSSEGSVMAIGPAGENLVRYASVLFDGHYAAGRGGLGAVMGSKRLKAVRVKGSGKVRIHSPDKLQKVREDIMRLLRACPVVFGEFGLSEYGTAALVDLVHARRIEPTANFRRSYFEGSTRYSGYRMKETFKVKKTGCAGCPILCKKKTREGKPLPEFETASHFGALNQNDSLEAIVEANRLCNAYGLDTITTAASLACYGEYRGKGLSPEEMVEMIEKIAFRKDTGDLLAEGSKRFCQELGRPELSMTVKGLELPAYDPRGVYGMALAYATSNRGACHLRAYPISYEILRKPVAVDRFTFEGKASMVKLSEDILAVVDSLTACKFAFFGASLEEYAAAYEAVTGVEASQDSLICIGEKIYLLERHLNQKVGFSRKDDTLPERFFQLEGYKNERLQIGPINREAFEEALQRYYRLRGYTEDGLLKEETLKGLLTYLDNYAPFKGIPEVNTED